MAAPNDFAHRNWLARATQWLRAQRVLPRREPRIGLALGGGFARGIAHIGVLRVLEEHRIPIHCISGVSAGSIVAAAFASGATTQEIEKAASSMRFRDIARWTLSRFGLLHSERMEGFLLRLLKVRTFEQMNIPLAVVASDLVSGRPVVFQGKGDVALPIRASCAYPGLFLPIRQNGCCLVDGMVSMDVPAEPLRRLGATHVISVVLPNPDETIDPNNLFAVVNRCFQVLTDRAEMDWRRHSSLVIAPDAHKVGWDDFEKTKELIEAGEKAARAVLPAILRWFPARPQGARDSSLVRTRCGISEATRIIK